MHRKRKMTYSKKGGTGASMRSQEFVDDDRGELRELRSNDVKSLNGADAASSERSQKPKALSTARRNSQVQRITGQNILSSERRRKEVTERSCEEF